MFIKERYKGRIVILNRPNINYRNSIELVKYLEFKLGFKLSNKKRELIYAAVKDPENDVNIPFNTRKKILRSSIT